MFELKHLLGCKPTYYYHHLSNAKEGAQRLWGQLAPPLQWRQEGNRWVGYFMERDQFAIQPITFQDEP